MTLRIEEMSLYRTQMPTRRQRDGTWCSISNVNRVIFKTPWRENVPKISKEGEKSEICAHLSLVENIIQPWCDWLYRAHDVWPPNETNCPSGDFHATSYYLAEVLSLIDLDYCILCNGQEKHGSRFRPCIWIRCRRHRAGRPCADPARLAWPLWGGWCWVGGW